MVPSTGINVLPLLAELALLPLGHGLCTYCQSEGEVLSEVMTPVWAYTNGQGGQGGSSSISAALPWLTS